MEDDRVTRAPPSCRPSAEEAQVEIQLVLVLFLHVVLPAAWLTLVVASSVASHVLIAARAVAIAPASCRRWEARVP